MPYSFKIWQVICDQNKEEKAYIIDMGNDPSFYCGVCGAEHNHVHDYPQDGHKVIDLGWYSIEELLPFLKKGKPDGWSV